ncbi:hypothetical protein POPTR_007G061741v4 [Populus trichocarpa]|uniref:Uncharacterized protein n=3 Tax=Populus TaxID=3689 RepID=A0ACC0SPR5_POPTR|nr:hypothetical protein [Populus alba]KAI5582012.1 hypothetical protein BDE02_07G056700 [Populus trichocarpa]UZA66031.1 hypothetical protein Podel.00MG000016 [Populus deltoides]KAI9391217.1 hypothetical protein POPTR_007G061741v4 [Populus trichocarpa]QAA78965.1 hypothetical protein [Populus alba]UZA65980.1 hypothetical protein Potri.00MG000016 [Populus trichocarpa]
MIRRKDEKADQLVKIYLSYFSVCRSIRLAKRLDRSILESIVSPSQVTDQWRDRIIDIVHYSRYLLVRYCPKIESMPLCQGVTFCPTWKAIPSRSKDKKGGIFTKLRDEIQYCLMIAHSVPKTLAGITPGSVPYEELVRNIGYPLWSHLVRYPYDQTNDLLSEILNRESIEFVHSFNKFSNPRDYELSRGSPGRLAYSTDAGAGKRRSHPIGNYLSQRLLKPLHNFHNVGSSPITRVSLVKGRVSIQSKSQLSRCSTAYNTETNLVSLIPTGAMLGTCTPDNKSWILSLPSVKRIYLLVDWLVVLL